MFRRKNAMGKPGIRWEDAVWRDVIDLLQILNWKAETRHREGWRKVIGESMARKWAEVD
jgi:hypothetical protein